MCAELIITAATGYQKSDIETFVYSFLQNTSASAAIVIQESDKEIHKWLQSNPRVRIFSIKTLSDPRHMVIKRFEVFQKIIEIIKPRKVLLCDSRDVFFQDSPIPKSITASQDSCLVLAEEPIKIHQCPINSQWIRRFFSSEALTRVGEKNVICAGTIGGQSQTVLELLRLLCEMLEEKQTQLKATPWGLDQACLNFLIHSKQTSIENIVFSNNDIGPWLTLHHEANISINKLGFVTPSAETANPATLIHQHDRLPWLTRHLHSQLIQSH